MATSSLYHNVTIENDEQARRFLEAVERSKKHKTSAKTEIRAVEMTDEEIKTLFEGQNQ
jgi:hypothetical protein